MLALFLNLLGALRSALHPRADLSHWHAETGRANLCPRDEVCPLEAGRGPEMVVLTPDHALNRTFRPAFAALPRFG
jgi:hypothetical protein